MSNRRASAGWRRAERVLDIVGDRFDDAGLVEVLGEARGEGLDAPFWRRVADIFGACSKG